MRVRGFFIRAFQNMWFLKFGFVALHEQPNRKPLNLLFLFVSKPKGRTERANCTSGAAFGFEDK